jgi:RNA polymerase sigma-70 factor (ECF subfamily)
MVHRRSAAGEDVVAVVQATSARDEVRLLRRVAEGELRAFEMLYRLYHPRLSRFVGNLVREPGLVEEVVNDTLLAVWRRPDSYNGASKVSTWIFAIAYRKALKARHRLDPAIEDKDSERRESGEAGPEEQVGARQVRAALVKAMGGLSEAHRTVIDLTYFHEMEYREIAEIMACPVDTVKTRMFHARRCLKTALAGSLADWL